MSPIPELRRKTTALAIGQGFLLEGFNRHYALVSRLCAVPRKRLLRAGAIGLGDFNHIVRDRSDFLYDRRPCPAPKTVERVEREFRLGQDLGRRRSLNALWDRVKPGTSSGC